MPPIPQQQASRAGLITTVVILAMMTVGLGAYTYSVISQRNKIQQELDAKDQTYAPYVSQNDMADAKITALKSVPKDTPAGPRATPPASDQTYLDVAVQQSGELASAITGNPTLDFVSSKRAAAAALSRAANDMSSYGVTVPNTSLVAAILTLSEAVKTKASAVQTAETQAQNNLEAGKDEVKQLRDQLAAKEKAAEVAAAALQKVKEDLARSDREKTEQGSTLKTANEEEIKRAGTQAADLQKQLNDKNDELKTALAQVDTLKKRIGQFHMPTKEAILQAVDARIVRVQSKDLCYIDLGMNDHLPVGLTFEVYDKGTGVPSLGGDTTSNDVTSLPVGKGSIEVIRIGTATSECRIIQTKTGEQLSEGDLCVNLVYDRNMKYKFFVYGEFDPLLTNQWSLAGADTVKNLIRRWGGEITDHIGPDTDFVIVGREPKQPSFGKEESGPVVDQMKLEYEKQKKAFEKVTNDAANFGIPVMNQARLFYFTGHFNQARR